MSVQDRNAHKDAAFIRKSLTVPIPAPGIADKDRAFFSYTPRFNYRLTDLSAFADAVATAAATIKAVVGKRLSAVGAPQLGADAAITFTIEAFDQVLNDGSLAAIAVTAAQAFTGTEVVTTLLWGVWTIQITNAGVITTKAQAPTMAFATEAEALAQAPAPDALNGLVGVLTLEAAGSDFTAGTDDTDTATSFNTNSRDGHSAALAIDTTPQDVQGTRGTSLVGPALVKELIGQADLDPVIVMVRSVGVPVFTEGLATVEFRKTPAQGEGVEASTGLSQPFVP